MLLTISVEQSDSYLIFCQPFRMFLVASTSE